jgi:hypothetical protein
MVPLLKILRVQTRENQGGERIGQRTKRLKKASQKR